jgi:protein subunit release factor B
MDLALPKVDGTITFPSVMLGHPTIKMERKLLFSVTKDDFEIQTFRSGGAGGQNQNKVNSGIRLIHRASGAVGEARDSRSQLQNKKSAFVRLVNSKKFQAWLKIETAKRLGAYEDIEKKVKELMKPENIKVETLVDGKWSL